ncbi:MAG: 16S rRNA (guanine(527)-N(7))-methyltransferase RsmG [Bacteroidales bacterium]|nr:16S rRNA (guanine(527)-N(7))-methyltransferase RsmG [Bacteroidales bacterium]
MLIPSEQDFAAAIALWREWNSRINVISRKDEDSIFAHHILHSLAIAQYLEFFYTVIPSEAKESILDVGTGGGFPGIPLAMVMPEAKFTLCDSIGKKVKVAQAVVDGLGLKNVECVNARVESLKGEWDWVVSRAVTSLDNFYPWVKGRFRNSILYLKGGDINTEIATLQKKYHIPDANIRTWRIDSWLKDDYFAEKFVIEIGKNYLCTP